jgi:uncharacterized membrane protein
MNPASARNFSLFFKSVLFATIVSCLPIMPPGVEAQDSHQTSITYQFVPIAITGATLTNPIGINDGGVIVGVEANPSGLGFEDRNGVFDIVSFPGSSSSAANGINRSGQIVGYYGGGNLPQR